MCGLQRYALGAACCAVSAYADEVTGGDISKDEKVKKYF